MSPTLLGPIVMRRSTTGALRLPRVALSGARTAIYPHSSSRESTESVRPSIGPDHAVEFDTSTFGACGRWNGELLRVPKPERKERLSFFLANHPGPLDLAWQEAEEQLASCFRSYRAFTLFERTLVLPAGPVVFQVEELPMGTLPDSPPEHVYGRICNAILRHPKADFRLLTPVFDVAPIFEEPVRLATSTHLQAMQFHGRNEVEAHAKRWGMLYRYRAWCELRAKARAEAEAAEALRREERRKAREVAELLVQARPEQLSPELVAIQVRVQTNLRRQRRQAAPLLDLGEMEQVMRRVRRFDPLVVFSEEGPDSSVKLVAHWMRIKTQTGEVKLLVHE